jgi:phage baseplate assembly protein W
VTRIDLAFPFGLDPARGATALVGYEDHVRDLIEQVLFTNPGERVNRPDFGAGLQRAVFMPEGDQAVLTLRAVVLSNLQKWLGQVITVEGVDLKVDDSTLNVIVTYRILATGVSQTERFSP